MLSVHYRGNINANMCDGDNVFYWFRQVTQNTQTSLCFGEGPVADLGEQCTGLHTVSDTGLLDDVIMNGVFSNTSFMYGRYISQGTGVCVSTSSNQLPFTRIQTFTNIYSLSVNIFLFLHHRFT